MENNIIWLIKMLLAHLTSDFLLQRSSWIIDRNQHKIKSKYLYIHAVITGVTAFVMVGYSWWLTILIITITHWAIDLWKSYTHPTFTNFLIDQAAHICVIFLAWAILFNRIPDSKTLSNFYYHDRFWIYATGIVFLTFPSSIIIEQATRKWAQQLNGNSVTGLMNAGKYIGVIERLIICMLVVQNQYEAIGLLITGKSILRYNSTNEEIKTEYLLVGTLISMALAFGTGLLFTYLQYIHVL